MSLAEGGPFAKPPQISAEKTEQIPHGGEPVVHDFDKTDLVHPANAGVLAPLVDPSTLPENMWSLDRTDIPRLEIPDTKPQPTKNRGGKLWKAAAALGLTALGAGGAFLLTQKGSTETQTLVQAVTTVTNQGVVAPTQPEIPSENPVQNEVLNGRGNVDVRNVLPADTIYAIDRPFVSGTETVEVIGLRDGNGDPNAFAESFFAMDGAVLMSRDPGLISALTANTRNPEAHLDELLQTSEEFTGYINDIYGPEGAKDSRAQLVFFDMPPANEGGPANFVLEGNIIRLVNPGSLYLALTDDVSWGGIENFSFGQDIHYVVTEAWMEVDEQGRLVDWQWTSQNV